MFIQWRNEAIQPINSSFKHSNKKITSSRNRRTPLHRYTSYCRIIFPILPLSHYYFTLTSNLQESNANAPNANTTSLMRITIKQTIFIANYSFAKHSSNTSSKVSTTHKSIDLTFDIFLQHRLILQTHQKLELPQLVHSV